MKATLNEIKELAKQFLNIADELSEKVDAYFNGSNDSDSVNAYNTVKAADKKFIDAVNSFYGCKEYEYGFNYEIAESFI